MFNRIVARTVPRPGFALGVAATADAFGEAVTDAAVGDAEDARTLLTGSGSAVWRTVLLPRAAWLAADLAERFVERSALADWWFARSAEGAPAAPSSALATPDVATDAIPSATPRPAVAAPT